MSVVRSSPTEPGRGVATALLRLVFAVIFGVTGFLLGREAYVHLISLHVASQFWQLAFLVGRADRRRASSASLIAPGGAAAVRDRSSTKSSARWTGWRRASWSAARSASSPGLVVAFLIKSILFEFVAFAGPTGGYIAIALYLVVSIFAAFLGARVGAKQRVTIGRLATPSSAAAAAASPRCSTRR